MMNEARSARLVMMLEPSLLKRIDDFRFTSRSNSRASAVRDLVELALKNGPAGAPTPPSLGSSNPDKGKANEQAAA